jgi:hypothetical protein
MGCAFGAPLSLTLGFEVSTLSTEPQIIHREYRQFMLLSCFTLCIYSLFLVLKYGETIGELIGRPRPKLLLAIVLTVISLGIFPGVYLSVLAFNLEKYSIIKNTKNLQRHLGLKVLALNIASLFFAIASGGVAIVLSVVIWNLAAWLLFNELNLYAQS